MTDYQAITDQVYESLLDANGGRLGSLDDVTEAVLARINPADMLRYLRALIESMVRRKDRQMLQLGESQQGSLLTGNPVAFEGVWAMGEGGRVRVPAVRQAEHLQRVTNQGKNAAAAMATAAAGQSEFSALLPFYRTPLTTLPEAVAAYHAAHGP